MRGPIAYGIDFGTTNTVVAVSDADGPKTLKLGDGGQETIPSVLLLHEGNRTIGVDAIRQYQANKNSGRFVYAIKGALSEELVNPEPFLTDYLRVLKSKADRSVGTTIDRVVLGYPVVFEGAEGREYEKRQALAMDRLKRSATKAGFKQVELVAEPQAATPGEGLPEGLAVTVDFGGGTFDVMVADVRNGHAEARAFAGVAVGGQLFDSMLFESQLADLMGLSSPCSIGGKQLTPPQRFRCDLGSWYGMEKLFRRREYGALKDYVESREGRMVLRWACDVFTGGQAHKFLRAIEDGKIALSNDDTAYVEFDWPGYSEEFAVTRRELEESSVDLLTRCSQAIDEALAKAGIGGEQVTTVVRTGGSCRLPVFVRQLEARFGADRLCQAPVFSSVAQGLATWGTERWS